MLILSRNLGQSFRVGTSIIRVVGVVGGQVKLGIEAPKEVEIWRAEIDPQREKMPEGL